MKAVPLTSEVASPIPASLWIIVGNVSCLVHDKDLCNRLGALYLLQKTTLYIPSHLFIILQWQS